MGMDEDMMKLERTLFPDEDNVALGDLKLPELLDEKEESEDEKAVAVVVVITVEENDEETGIDELDGKVDSEEMVEVIERDSIPDMECNSSET